MRKKKPIGPVKLDVNAQSIHLDITGGLTRSRYVLKAPDNSVDELTCTQLFHRIPGKLRGKFMDEVWRVLKLKAKATFIVPYWSSMRAIADYEHEWPPVSEMSFAFFNREEREKAGIDRGLKCDLIIDGYGYGYDPETQTKSSDAQPFWVKHYLGAVTDLHVVLSKRS